MFPPVKDQAFVKDGWRWSSPGLLLSVKPQEPRVIEMKSLLERGAGSQQEKFLLCSISLIMTQLNRPENFNLGTRAHKDTQGLAVALTHIPQSGCQAELQHQHTSHFCLEYLSKASQEANVDICARLWLSCFFSLICQDNHFPHSLKTNTDFLV